MLLSHVHGRSLHCTGTVGSSQQLSKALACSSSQSHTRQPLLHSCRSLHAQLTHEKLDTCLHGKAPRWILRTLLAREHKRIRAEYEERVKQLEQERQGVEEERVQVSLQTA